MRATETTAISVADDSKTQLLGLDATYDVVPATRTTEPGPEHERDERQRLQFAGPSPSWYFPNASTAVEKPSLHAPRTAAAAVMLRMRHTLGAGAGLARSVVSDMERKSLVMNSRTSSTGVRPHGR